MRDYVAQKRQKRPCDLCGEPVVPGDPVTSWCYLGDEPPHSGNIIRVHAACYTINVREEIDEFRLGKAFVCYEHREDSTDAEAGHPHGACPLLLEAREAVGRDRKACPACGCRRVPT